MNYKKEARYYLYFDDRGKERHRKVTYILWFDNTKLVEVRNELGSTVEQQSECWEFFNKKYNE